MADAAGATNELADVSNERPDLVALGQERLSWLERRLIAFVRWTFEPGFVDRLVRRLQRIIGSTWIHHFTKHLRFVFGMERLPPFEKHQSYVLVSNHRSFFDLYVVTGHLVRLGLKHRILFPVRASFFYDSPLGLFVNGVMSFFAMYPPIFRERKKAFLNPASIEELGWLLRRGGMLAGIHPEGTRNLGDDPYSFLPAQRGVGKIIHAARVPVIPVFVNGLINDLPRQIGSNFDGTGRKIVVVFGAPVDFGELLLAPSTPKVHQAIADRTLEAIATLGSEERKHRAALETVVNGPAEYS
ncbi:MAG TPA: lysophospholipid acyltransferase family protein [Polyangiaceae bacterium]|nr:lysophospholipid acyltransferase family protein [Polyangiaceae bacterium]